MEPGDYTMKKSKIAPSERMKQVLMKGLVSDAAPLGEADRFASGFLIPPEAWSVFCDQGPFSPLGSAALRAGCFEEIDLGGHHLEMAKGSGLRFFNRARAALESSALHSLPRILRAPGRSRSGAPGRLTINHLNEQNGDYTDSLLQENPDLTV